MKKINKLTSLNYDLNDSIVQNYHNKDSFTQQYQKTANSSKLFLTRLYTDLSRDFEASPVFSSTKKIDEFSFQSIKNFLPEIRQNRLDCFSKDEEKSIKFKKLETKIKNSSIDKNQNKNQKYDNFMNYLNNLNVDFKVNIEEKKKSKSKFKKKISTSKMSSIRKTIILGTKFGSLIQKKNKSIFIKKKKFKNNIIISKFSDLDNFLDQLLKNIKTIHKSTENSSITTNIIKSCLGFSKPIGKILLNKNQTEFNLYLTKSKMIESMQENNFLELKTEFNFPNLFKINEKHYLVDWEFFIKLNFFNNNLEDLISEIDKTTITQLKNRVEDEFKLLKEKQRQYLSKNMKKMKENELKLLKDVWNKNNDLFYRMKFDLQNYKFSRIMEKLERNVGKLQLITSVNKIKCKHLDDLYEIYE